MKVKIGITGASGMLGTALVVHLSKEYKIFATSRSKGVEGENIEWDCFNLTNATLLNSWLENVNPDIVIHCAAIVDVDLCEENINLATALHVKATKVMASYLDNNNSRLIYISTDSVFDGKKQSAYNESDLVMPLNVYAETKIIGERITQSICGGLVLRTNIVGWTQGSCISFAEWLLKGLTDGMPLNLFYDVNFSPLSVYDFSHIIEKIIENPVFGLYHCTSKDGISKYNFGKKMAKIFQLSDSAINKVSVANMMFKAKRPKNMVLDSKKLAKDIDYEMPTAVESIISIKNQQTMRK
jgi:dTDP-4-dehydrorhamnose reductase